MKRILIPGLMLVAALALTNCAEQLETPLQENDIVVEETMGALSEDCVPYEVFVESAETKTRHQDGRTSWINDVDEIALFHKKTDGDYQYHSKFVYAGDGAFKGNLVNSESLADKNDWYAIYPYNSSSAATITAYPVTIGAELQTQTKAGSMDDIAGPNCPLYGIKNGVSRKNAPKFKMSHMFAVIALNIVNEGHGGDIAVKSAGIAAAEEIVGDFDVNILGNPSKNIYDPVFTKKTNAKKSTKVELSNAVVIGSGKSATLYLAVKPFDASGKELTISINGDAKKGNGASKTIKMPAGSKFEAGKVTTITVPVNKLSFHNENVDPATSNVMGVKVQVLDKIDGSIFTGGYKIKYKEGLAVTTSGSSTADVIINGKETKAYVIGTESKVGTISIHGTAQELINYMPMEFYAAAWNNNKAVMRVESVTIHTDLAVAVVMGHKLSLNYGTLTSMMDGGKITFSGLVPLEQITYNGNSKSHMVIMDEEPYHKPISIEKFESLLASFDNNPKDNFKPTFEGLRAALLNPGSLRSSYTLDSENLTEAEITAYTVWKKIDTKVSSSDAMKFAAALTGDVLKSPKGLFEFASKSPIDVVLTTVARGGEEGATDNRLIFWGLNSPEVN